MSMMKRARYDSIVTARYENIGTCIAFRQASPRLPPDPDFSFLPEDPNVRPALVDLIELFAKERTPCKRAELLEALGEHERRLQFICSDLLGVAIKANATPLRTKWTRPVIVLYLLLLSMVDVFVNEVVGR